MTTKVYSELTLTDVNQSILPILYKNQQALTLADAIDMLVMWGTYNRYKSRCGYQRISSVFTSLYPSKSFVIIESSINMIDDILLKLKTSTVNKQKLQYTIIEAYYKGVDLVVDGYDWSQKLTIRDIANYLSLPKSTVANRKKEAERFILQALVDVS